MRTKKRTLVANKVYGFNPWMDQLLAINQIMETTGQKSEAPIIRDLIDESLSARRRKSSGTEISEQAPPSQELEQILQTVQALLLKMIEQGQVAFRVQSLTLELLQETLVEARAARMGSWEQLAVPALRTEGKSGPDIAQLLETQTTAAKDFAYALAEEIKNEILTADAQADSSQAQEDDRQGRLRYDDTDVQQDGGPKAA